MVIDQARNIVLIGMPGCGKSTIGVLLAKATMRDFIDTDVLIQRCEAASLRDIIAAGGVQSLLAAEERVLVSLQKTSHVIATGGSAIYSAAGMAALQRQGDIVFLDVPLSVLEERLGDLNARGVVREPNQDLAAIFEERRPLYQAAADHRIDCAGLTQQEIVNAIAAC